MPFIFQLPAIRGRGRGSASDIPVFAPFFGLWPAASVGSASHSDRAKSAVPARSCNRRRAGLHIMPERPVMDGIVLFYKRCWTTPGAVCPPTAINGKINSNARRPPTRRPKLAGQDPVRDLDREFRYLLER